MNGHDVAAARGQRPHHFILVRMLTPTLAGESLIARVMPMDALIEQSAQATEELDSPW